MGLGRFGPGGCCTCSENNELPPRYGAGVCAWCGPCTSGPLPSPQTPEQYCDFELSDSFDTLKRMPDVPWWQSHELGYGADHVQGGKYLYAMPDRYYQSQTNAAGVWSWPNFNAVLDLSGWNGTCYYPEYGRRLVNLPPAGYSPYPCDYSYRRENGLVVQSPTISEDVLPIKMSTSLAFNLDKSQAPQWFAYQNLLYVPVTAYTSSVEFSLLDPDSEPCQYGVYASPIYTWSGGSHGGRLLVRVRAAKTLSFPVAAGDSIFIDNLQEYWGSTVPLTLYWELQTQSYSSPFSTVASGYALYDLPWGQHTATVEVVHEKVIGDNRKMNTSVLLKVGDMYTLSGSSEMPRPGYSYGGSATDPQYDYQKFCGHYISASCSSNGIQPHQSGGSQAACGWYPGATPRESYWMDDWYALASRP